MKYTKNYHLPQWVKSDRVMMDDFNQMNASIETGLTSAAQTASEAKTAASAALSAANNAYSPDQKPYVIGSYTGDGGIQQVTLGFRPAFLIISGMASVDSFGIVQRTITSLGVSGGNRLKDRCAFTDTGFEVRPMSDEYNRYPDLNGEGRKYDYIAFR